MEIDDCIAHYVNCQLASVVPLQMRYFDADSTQSQTSLQQQMELAMKASMNPPLPTSTTAVTDRLLAAIKTEMVMFDSSGVRGRCLQLAYSHLLSIPRTSVEAERAFSAAGLLCTKLRSRLGDRTLDTLCFLRTFYQGRKPAADSPGTAPAI